MGDGPYVPCHLVIFCVGVANRPRANGVSIVGLCREFKTNLIDAVAWEQRKLGELTTKVTQKNGDMDVTETFTNSAEFGVVSQLDFFDHDIAKEESIGGYFVVQPEDFVYNPRISVTAPVGPINRNRLGRAGVMSPLYTVFRPGDAIDNAYLEHYFETSGWHDFMQLNGNSGARSDRFSIPDSVFFEMPIPYPSIKEQVSIANTLEGLDSLITLHQRESSLNLHLQHYTRLVSERMTRSTSLFSSSWMMWRYVFSVVFMLACPRRLATLAMDTPANSSNEAWVWRSP